jgi:hypothetical protein
MGHGQGWPSRLSLSVLAALALGWLGGTAHFVALGLDQPPVLALFVWLAGLSLWPLLQPQPRRLGWIVAAVLLLAAAGTVAVLRFTDAAGARHPQATTGYYVAEQTTGKFWLATPAQGFSAWSQALLAAGTGPAIRRPLPPLMTRPFAAPANPVATPPYEVVLRQAPDCTVTLSAPWSPGARALSLELTAAPAASAVTIGGRPADILKVPNGRTGFYWRPAEQGVSVSLLPTGPGKIAVRYALTLGEWPADAAPTPPRSPAQMAWGDSDALVLLGALEIAAAGC